MKSPVVIWLLFTLIVLTAKAGDSNQENPPWKLKTRLILTGSSDHSVPKGYLVYSALSIEPSLIRILNKKLSLELNLRIESHEIDSMTEGINEGLPLGSIELIPLNLILQYHFIPTGTFQPYLGVGINSTFFWEKSGSLNSTDLSPGIGPSVQLGTDIDFKKTISLNIQVGWNTLRTDIKSNGLKIAHLKIDPLALGVGIGYQF